MDHFIGVIVFRLLTLLCLFISFSVPGACPDDLTPKYQMGETVFLKVINDGDTVSLTNGKLVRFIGINTPEINHKDNRLSEPFALQARQLLESKIQKGDKLNLVYDHTHHDKYGRLLAYVFTENGDNLSLRQLQSGFAKHWVIGRNDLFWQCFQDAESKARLSKKGSWANFEPLIAENLSRKDIGYQYIQGQINVMKETEKGLQLTLDDKLNVNLNKRALVIFRDNNISFNLDQKLLLRGKLNYFNDAFNLSIYHPAQILP